ncbi:MAG: serine/threonine-protein phosphatase, partial [Desulfuromonadales bacterium]|nr:serine/threonine-protein phosphatase [Desulfuromonadales bacterium]
RYANAGHNLPLHYHAATGTVSELDAEGLILGVKKEFSYIEEHGALEPGDILLLYTDGITEAENADGEFFGVPRLQDVLVASKDKGAQEII